MERRGRRIDVITRTDTSVGTVNGQKFYTPFDMFGLIVTTVNTGAPISIVFYEPAIVDALYRLGVTTKEELEKRLLSQIRPLYRGDVNGGARFVAGGAVMALSGWEWALIIGAIGTAAAVLAASVPVILAMGAATFLVLLGVAIIIAVMNGYDVQDFRYSTTSDGRPTVEFSLRKA